MAHKSQNLTPEQRFIEKVVINPITGCWEWQAYRNKKGYGHFMHDGEILAHRVSYKIYLGKLPKGLFVCHTCDNPPCVNPEHFFLGTNKQNINDAQEKGRIPTAKHPSSMSYKNGCRCDLCRSFLKNTNMLSELKRKGIFDGEKFDMVTNEINRLKQLAT